MRPPADVIGSGSDEQRPTRRGLRGVLAIALGAAVLGGVLLDERRNDASAPGPEAAAVEEGLRLVETGGTFSLAWGYAGRLDISLPLLIHNDGPDVTVASLALDGTALEQPAVDVALSRGGRLPLTLRQSMSCREDASVPPNAALRLEISQDGVGETRWLPLSPASIETLAIALEQQCGAVPLEQTLVLQAEQENAFPHAVELRVVADNIGSSTIQLLSLEPATGLDVTVVPTPGAPADRPSLPLPLLLGEQRVVFRIAVSIRDCAALALRDRIDQVGVADLAYDDGGGGRAVKAVAGDFPGLRDLVEGQCRTGAPAPT